jgi:hypothetical protein
MTASYRLIDYSLRPAKFAERRMLSEMFSRLKAFGSLESYRYIGFGSIWFTDCVLFHRALGIEDIISIEKEQAHQARFDFNNPYRGIELRMGTAAEVLPGLDWTHRSIVWLDYDDPLSPSILDDVRTIATRAMSGTALAVSVQTGGLVDKRPILEEPIDISEPEQFREAFGDARTPLALNAAALRGWTLSKTSRSIISDEIEAGLQVSNAGRSAGQALQFRVIGAFEYADGAKMTTLVGVFVDQGQNGLFESAGFRELPFYRNGEDALRIKVPLLTPREMRHLDRSLPCPNGDALDLGPIPESDGKNYAKLYRYLPNFASFEP